ncbi:receptor-like protein 46 [Fagus crenata]
MIETVDTYSSSLYTTFEYGYRSFPTKFGDLIVNWKKSKQGLSSDNLLLYYLLDLSMNQLSGEIPTSFGSLKALKLLNISHNNLSRMVPASLGDLESLEGLDLSYNKLLGSIPQSFAKLQELTILDVSKKKLTGKIPIGRQMDTMNNPNFYANNNGLCGMQIQVQCPEELAVPPTKSAQVEIKETWFSWQGVGIGYSIGFFLTVGSIYLNGHFICAPPPNCHRQQRRSRV